MALVETLKATALFLAIIALIIFIVLMGEVVIIILVRIIDEAIERRRRSKLWEE